MAEILDEVEKGYGADELKGINKKIDTATTDENNLNELLKDKKEEEIAQAEKDKRTELSKKLDELRKERTARLEELGPGQQAGRTVDRPSHYWRAACSKAKASTSSSAAA